MWSFWLPLIFLFTSTLRNCNATWSILLANTETKEVGVASVTCVSDLDLKALLPVVVPGVGVAACQAFGDLEGIRRPIIRQGLLDGKTPTQILAQIEEETDESSSESEKYAEMLLSERSHDLSFEELKEAVSNVPGHQFRQYGIVDVTEDNPALTFTGADNVDYAGGMTGQVGPVKYAIQGNMLAGECVLERIQMYIKKAGASLEIPDLLFYSLKIGDSLGGDGRCSCDPSSNKITSCGCPVQSGTFEKSGRVGFVIAAKADDADGSSPCDAENGCATGDYYIQFDSGALGVDGANPVSILETQYRDWKSANARNKFKTEL